jgi:hypothetical protein
VPVNAVPVNAVPVNAGAASVGVASVDVASAVLDDAVLDDAVLDDAAFDDAVLDSAVLDGAVLDSAVHAKAVLDGAAFDGAVPASVVPASAVPDSTVLDGAVPASAVLEGVVPASTATASATTASTATASTATASTATASAATASTATASTAPGNPITHIHVNYGYILSEESAVYKRKAVEYHNNVLKILSECGLCVQNLSSKVIFGDTRIEMMCSGDRRHLWWCKASEIVSEVGNFGINPICTYGCPLCRYESRFVKYGKNPKRFFENIVRHIDEKSAVGKCPLGHRTLINDINTPPVNGKFECEGCSLERMARYCRRLNIIMLGSVYTSPNCFMRYQCMDCGAQAYLMPIFITEQGHLCVFNCRHYKHMPKKYDDVINTIRAFETIYHHHFDDFSPELFAECPPLGYNKELRIAFYHLKLVPESKIQKNRKRIEDAGVKIVIVPESANTKTKIVTKILQQVVVGTDINIDALAKQWVGKIDKNLKLTGFIFN